MGIVGAGIIGCAIARALSARRVSVTVFEPRAVGRGATQASAGALVPYVEAHEGGPLLALSTRSLALYDEFIRDVRSESGVDVDYARCGSLEIAFTSGEEAILRAAVVRHPDAGLRWLDCGELLSLEPRVSREARGAVLVDTHGYVFAPQLTEALATAARLRGTAFVAERVTGVVPASNGADIITDRATASFDHVVIASGAWAGFLRVAESATPIPVRPIKGQLLRVRGASLTRLVWSHACYFVPQANGDVLIGATMEDVGFDERPTAEASAGLLEAARQVLPGLAPVSVVETRAGLRPSTSDNLPLVGHPTGIDSITYAVGHFRNGVILAPLTAELVAALVLDGHRDSALDVLSPARFGL